MIKFDNKLEIRYSFNDKSAYMDAWIKHRCEKEILSMLRVLADLLDDCSLRTLFTRRWIPRRMADSRRKFALYLCRIKYSDAGTDPAYFVCRRAAFG